MTYNDWKEAPSSGSFTVISDLNYNDSIGQSFNYKDSDWNKEDIWEDGARFQPLNIYFNFADLEFYPLNEENKKLKELIKQL